MKLDPVTVHAYRLVTECDDDLRLDPVHVIWQDFPVASASGTQAGRLIVECYGRAWSAYWPATGCNNVREFVARADVHYLVGCLDPRARTAKDREYLGRIVEAVKRSLKHPDLPLNLWS